MEQIYLRQDDTNNAPRRLWHSDKIKISEYFERYSEEVNRCLQNGKFKFNHVFKYVLPDSISLNEEIFDTLEKLTCIDQLMKPKGKCPKLLKMKQLLNEKTLPSSGREITIMGFGLKEESNSSENILIHNELEDAASTAAGEHIPGENGYIEEYGLIVHEHDRDPGRRNYRNRIVAPEHATFYRTRFLLKGGEKRGRTNLIAGWDYFVSFRVQEPFRREYSPPSQFLQEIRVLASQTLEELRDKIICASDFQDVQGDLSDRPLTPITFMTRDIYRSAMFYIDNTFYIDRRHTDNVDYSDVIRKWAIRRGINVGLTLDMGEITISKLTLRFGYPYLYLHQGCCEHLIIVNDARLLNEKDSRFARDYPLMSSLHRAKNIYCIICLTRSARWIVTGNDLLMYDVSHMCDSCFYRFNYKDGKKQGDFKAYRFVDPGSLL